VAKQQNHNLFYVGSIPTLISLTNLDLLKLITFGYVELLLMVACILILVAFFTLAERKLMALVQRRRGPNVTGFAGLIQPIADGVKLIFKEIILPKDSNKFFFLFAPVITFSLAMATWPFVLSFVPQNKYTIALFSVIATSDFSLIIVFAISSLSIFGIIISG
jgi:NADH-quinone oxidoreductase subunit H